MPKRCLKKRNVDTTPDQTSLNIQPLPAITSPDHDRLTSYFPSYRSLRSVFTLWLTTRPPKKSGGRSQTDISLLRRPIPRHPGQRSSTEKTADSARYGQ